MITGAGQTGDGKPLLFLGLSGENVTRLAAGEPIRIAAAELEAMGLPAIGVVISYGRSEDDIMAQVIADSVLKGRGWAETPPSEVPPPPGTEVVTDAVMKALATVLDVTQCRPYNPENPSAESRAKVAEMFAEGNK